MQQSDGKSLVTEGSLIEGVRELQAFRQKSAARFVHDREESLYFYMAALRLGRTFCWGYDPHWQGLELTLTFPAHTLHGGRPPGVTLLACMM